MKKKYITMIVSLAIIATGAIAFLGVSLYNTTNSLGTFRSQLNYVYRQNFYELTDNVNEIESDLGKLTVSDGKSNVSKYLSNVSNASAGAQSNITQLPIEHNTIDNTIKFINQLNGYIYTLQLKIANKQSLSLDDMDQIEILHSASESIKYELNKLSVMLSSGNYEIINNISNPNANSNKFSDDWGGLNNDTIQYPTLIYDGPFSDSTEHKTIVGLSEKIVDESVARKKLEKVFANSTITFQGEIKGGEFDVYNYLINDNNNCFYAQISKRDAKLLQLNSDIPSNTNNRDLSECEKIAIDFAKKLDFGDLVVAWSTINSGYAYINLTPQQNAVIIYPDLIKVKISLQSGVVCGWEAKSWAYNHKQRGNLLPTIDLLKAKMALNKNLDVRQSRLCLIPGDYVGEILAYEFQALYNGAIYYVYIDANTGKQYNILKIVETDDGDLLM